MYKYLSKDPASNNTPSLPTPNKRKLDEEQIIIADNNHNTEIATVQNNSKKQHTIEQVEATVSASMLNALPLSWRDDALMFYSMLQHPEQQDSFIALCAKIIEHTSNTNIRPQRETEVASPVVSYPPMYDASTIICSFPDLTFQVPRGRFDLHITQSDTLIITQQKQQQQHTSIIPITSIQHLLSLTDPNKRDQCIVIGVSSSIHAMTIGKTSYDELIIKFDVKQFAQVKNKRYIQLNDDNSSNQSQIIKQHVQSLALDTRPLHSLFLSTLTRFTPIAVTIPNAAVFQSSASSPSVTCCVGVNDGLLYPLPNGLFFMRKPTQFISLDQIDGITMSRGQGGNNVKTFDLHVEVNSERKADSSSKSDATTTVTFSVIGSQEQPRFELYAHYVKKYQRKQEQSQNNIHHPVVQNNQQNSQQEEKSSSSSSSVGPAAIASPSEAAVSVSVVSVSVVDSSDSEADSDYAPLAEDDGSGSSSGSDSDDSQYDSDMVGEESGDEEEAASVEEQHENKHVEQVGDDEDCSGDVDLT